MGAAFGWVALSRLTADRDLERHLDRVQLAPIERDAIVQTLLDHHGSKAKGAGSLGMSRATIYRKIHQYGIITPAS